MRLTGGYTAVIAFEISDNTNAESYKIPVLVALYNSSMARKLPRVSIMHSTNMAGSAYGCLYFVS